MYSIITGRFPVWYLFLLSFWVIRYVFRLWGLPRVILVLLSYRLSIQPFRYAFSVSIFSSKIVRFIWNLIVSMFLCHALPIVDKFFFRCFEMSCFVCIVLPFVDIFLVFLLSLEHSILFPQVVLFFSHVVFSILFPHILRSFCFTILACFCRFFLSGFPVELPILVSSCFLRGAQFFTH